MRARRPSAAAAFGVAAAAFACYLVDLAAAPSGSRVAELVDNWFYVGLFIVAVVLVGARAVLVADDRLAWSILALALACTGFAEVYYLAATPDSYPSVGRVWALPLATSGPRRTAALWLDGATAAGDLGKLAVPDEILRKRGPLDEREWEFIRQHTVVGERILRASPALKDVSPLVRSSHEKWDGSGYPDELVGEAIPLAWRIIRVCDAFTAMTAARPYREALTEDAALGELEQGAGVEYDPGVARVAVTFLRERQRADRAA